MNWKLLKENKCPQCEKDFAFNLVTIINYRRTPDDKPVTMHMHGCGFKISERRYAQIVNSQVTASLEKEWEKEMQENRL